MSTLSVAHGLHSINDADFVVGKDARVEGFVKVFERKRSTLFGTGINVRHVLQTRREHRILASPSVDTHVYGDTMWVCCDQELKQLLVPCLKTAAAFRFRHLLVLEYKLVGANTSATTNGHTHQKTLYKFKV